MQRGSDDRSLIEHLNRVCVEGALGGGSEEGEEEIDQRCHLQIRTLQQFSQIVTNRVCL